MASHSNILMATALVSSLLFGCAGQVHAKTPAFTQVKESKGELSKLLRSNTRHFWASMKETEYQGPMSKYLSYEGVITGDPHFGNFALIPLIDKKGKETLEFANIDFDDAGIGPFAFDFVRLVVATKAIEFDLNDSEDKFARVGEMVRAYADGLEGEEVATPDLITLYLKKGIKYYNKELKELVEKKTDTSGNKILLEKDLVKLPKSMHHLRDDVEALFKDDGMDVLDIVAIEKSRGGSVDAERMMVLVKDGSDRRLFDLKERQDTAVSAYEKQSDVAEWLSQLYPVFWPDKSPSTYTLVKLNGKDFWVREKKKSLIDVPYDAKKSAEVAYLKALAPYVSNLLGRIHGSQASAKGLKTLLKSPEGTAAFQQAVKTTYRTYIDEARKALSLPTSNDGKKKSGQISCRAAAGG